MRTFTFTLLILAVFQLNIFSQSLTFKDHDNDGIEDAIDLDDDNDGILDEVEMMQPLADADNDGIENQFDLDSDNDGIPDLVEAYYVDVNGDGIIDNFIDENKDGVMDNLPSVRFYADMDADGLANWIDLDSDGDGTADVFAAGGIDVNNDGRLDDFRDVDVDGLNDNVDGDIGNMLAPGDISQTVTSAKALVKTFEATLPPYINTPQRMIRYCLDTDKDGLCDDVDGDIGNNLPLGLDFVQNEM